MNRLLIKRIGLLTLFIVVTSFNFLLLKYVSESQNKTFSNKNSSRIEISQQSDYLDQKEDIINAIPSSLTIPKLGVVAPIVLNVSGLDKDIYLKSLEDGVAHLKNTVSPGEKGNSVIFGHSSYYLNKPGNYKEIFSSLNKLDIGDNIQIKNDNNTISYKVTNKKIVIPTQTDILEQETDKYILTLITCWPIGTVEKRLIITAEIGN